MKAWEQFLALQEVEVGKETVNKWLRTLKVLRFDACNLYLEAKDSFQALWFEEQMREKVKTRLLNPNSKLIKVHLTVAGSALIKPAKTRPLTAPSFTITFDSLDPHCTFDSFVGTKGSELAEKVLKEPLKVPSFNPIYIYGPPGSGKTHLLMATAKAALSYCSHVTYVRAETFTDHVVAAIRAGQMSLFRQAYRQSDMLLIDNAEVFSRKSATQEELFHTFNTLHLSCKPIVIAANVAPADLQYVEPRLVSRFEWGISLGLELPTKEEAAAILQKKAELLNFSLRPQIIEFLLETFPHNPKHAVRALEALILRTHIRDHGTKNNPSSLTIAAVKHFLNDLIDEERKNALTSDRILRATANYFSIPLEDVLSKSRSRECVLPRQMAMYLCREMLKMPFIKVGDLFSRDHSTVMSSVRLVQKLLDGSDPQITSSYQAILKKLAS